MPDQATMFEGQGHLKVKFKIYVKTTARSAPGGRFYFDDTQSHWVLSAPDMKGFLLMMLSIQNHLDHLDFC